MTRRDPEWTQADRDVAMALEDYEAQRCGSCGLPKSICHAKENSDRFVAEGPDRCHATTAVIAARERHGETNQPQALNWVPVLRD